MGIFKRVFAGKRKRNDKAADIQAVPGSIRACNNASMAQTSRAHEKSTSAGLTSSASMRQAVPAEQKQTAEPERTQEELFEIARTSYIFGGKDGLGAVPLITDINALRRLESSARHPAVQISAKRRKEVLLEEKRAEAKRQVAQIATQKELVALAEDEETDEYLRRAAAKAVTEQAVLKRWAIEQDNRSFLNMLERITNTSDVVDIARNAKDPKTRSKATEMIEEDAVLRNMASNRWGDWAQAFERLGGYECTSCHATVLPEGDEAVPCICPDCGAPNHDWEFVNEVTDYRDYSAGNRWDECRRCHEKKNMESVYTGGM